MGGLGARRSEQLLGAVVVCCVLGLACWPAGASAAESLSAGTQPPSFEGPLLAPSGELLGSQPIEAVNEAERSRPEAVAERAASRTRYVGLNRAEAVSLAEKVFHVEKASWTSPGGI
jgi:hypothetical protein